MAKAKDPIVIIGGGRAAASFVDAYREAGGDALITIVSADESPPYNRPPLSKGVLRGEMEPAGALAHEAEEWDDLVVELRLETRVDSVDASAHTVQLADGESLPFGTLVVASGAHPRRLPYPAATCLPCTPFARSPMPSRSPRQAPEARKILVVGGSFIGSEVAASLRLLGLEVTLVEQGDHLVPALVSEELSSQVEDLYREHGVDLLLGEQIEEFRANGRSLTGAATASGREIEAFLAVVGVGVEPDTGFLEGSGLELDNGVVVDDHFKSSADDIYAIGDVARFDDTVSGRPRRIEHWSNAHNQGTYLGRTLAEGGRTAYAEVAGLLHEAVRPPAPGARRPGRGRRRGRDSRLDPRPQPARVPPSGRPARRRRRCGPGRGSGRGAQGAPPRTARDRRSQPAPQRARPAEGRLRGVAA